MSDSTRIWTELNLNHRYEISSLIDEQLIELSEVQAAVVEAVTPGQKIALANELLILSTEHGAALGEKLKNYITNSGLELKVPTHQVLEKSESSAALVLLSNIPKHPELANTPAAREAFWGRGTLKLADLHTGLRAQVDLGLKSVAERILEDVDQGKFKAYAPLASAAFSYLEGAIYKADRDTRGFATFTLDNGLSVFLVHDENAIKGVVFVDVLAGAFVDPNQHLGLMHHFEHIVGESGGWSTQVEAVGASHNSSTDTDRSTHYFRATSENLENLLVPFAKRFVDPDMSDDAIVTARNIVQEEFALTLQNPAWNQNAVENLFENPDHPSSRFRGNANSLAGPPEILRASLTEAFSTYQTANLMNVVMVSQHSVQRMRDLITTAFKDTPPGDTPPPDLSGPLVQKPFSGHVQVQGVDDTRTLRLRFPIPTTADMPNSRPYFSVGDLIADQGEGSALFELKENKKWVLGMGAWAMAQGYEDYYNIDITLTEEGVKHTEDIIALIMSQIKLVQTRGITEERHNQRQFLFKNFFHNLKEPGDTLDETKRIAANIRYYGAPKANIGDFEVGPYNGPAAQSFLDYLNQGNMLAVLTTPNKLDTDTKTPHFNTPYISSPWSDSALKRFQDARKTTGDLALPGLNPWIPIPSEMNAPPKSPVPKQPVELESPPGTRLYFAEDHSFGIRIASYNVNLMSPSVVATTDVSASVLNDIYATLVQDQANSKLYLAGDGSLGFEVYAHLKGISIRTWGPDAKQPLLLDKLMQEVANPVFDEEYFRAIKGYLETVWGQQEDLTDAAQSEVSHHFLPRSFSNQEKIKALEGLTHQNLRDHITQLAEGRFAEILVHGTVTAEDAKAAAAKVKTTFHLSSEATKVKRPKVDFSVTDGRLNLARKENRSVALVHRLSDGTDPTTRANMKMLTYLLDNPMHKKFREGKEVKFNPEFMGEPDPIFIEIGIPNAPTVAYVAYARTRHIEDRFGIDFAVSSEALDAGPLETEITSYLEKFLGDNFENDTLSARQAWFDSVKKSLLASGSQDETILRDRSQRWWLNIAEDDYDFSEKQDFLDALKALALDDFEIFAKDFLSSNRKSLVVYSDRTTK